MAAQSRRILYIDDDADDREFLRNILRDKDESIELTEAENGRIAIGYLQEDKRNGTLPCLIVLDLNMPVLNGRDTFNFISGDEILKNVPLLIFTSSENPTDRIFFETKGAELISKPADMHFFQVAADRMLKYCS